MKDTWTRKEVAEITGIPDRRVLFYTEQPLLLPGIKTDTGRGTARAYGLESIFYLLLIKELSALGLSLTRIRLIINSIQAATMEPRLYMPGFPEFKLWHGGKFTETSVIIVIDTEDSEETEISLQYILDKAEVNIKLDKPSQIIINLNKIFEKAVF